MQKNSSPKHHTLYSSFIIKVLLLPRSGSFAANHKGDLLPKCKSNPVIEVVKKSSGTPAVLSSVTRNTTEDAWEFAILQGLGLSNGLSCFAWAIRALTALARALLVADHLASLHCRGSLSSHGALMRKTVNLNPKPRKP